MDIDPDNTIICIYHHHCADGLGAAWAVHRALGHQVEFRPGNYGRGIPEGDFTDRDVLIVDFSFPREQLDKLAAAARSVLILDHHKSAQEQLAGLPTIGVPYDAWLKFNGKDGAPYPAALFDMDRSGAGITWDFFFPHAPRPEIINLVEDRDLWRFKNPDSRAFNAVLNSYELGSPTEMPRGGEYPSRLAMFDQWHEWTMEPEPVSDHIPPTDYHNPWHSLIQGGRDILRSNDAMVASFVRSSRRIMKIGGVIVPVANVPGSFASDAGHLLCAELPFKEYDKWPHVEVIPNPAHSDDQMVQPLFSATYYDSADGKRHFSLRSPEDGADVSKIAGSYGGGGHAHAAGFERPMGWEGDE